MLRRFVLMLLLGGYAALLMGCASTSSGQKDVIEKKRPSLSMSASRTVPREDASISQTAEPKAQPVASAETGITFYRFKSGDPVVIQLRGIYPKDESVEDIIDEDGNVTIPLIGDILAAGKSTSQLEAEIARLYIDGGYYRTITVTVVMPSPFYFIRGEIRLPGRYPVVSGVTILQAIAAGGGYTEFANPKSVKLIRGKTTTTLNMRDIERNPEKDVRLESGDVIVVDRSIL
jgi:polysaccharide biosynthesis/export protein VpsN